MFLFKTTLTCLSVEIVSKYQIVKKSHLIKKILFGAAFVGQNIILTIWASASGMLLYVSVYFYYYLVAFHNNPKKKIITQYFIHCAFTAISRWKRSHRFNCTNHNHSIHQPSLHFRLLRVSLSVAQLNGTKY